MKEYKLVINGNNYNVVIGEVEETSAMVEVNGTSYTVEFEKPVAKSAPIKIIRTSTPAAVSAVKPIQPMAPVTGSTPVKSPLPGVILEIKCAVGNTVKKGDVILILEAMKMENVIEATANGKIESIQVNKGDSVLEGDTLVVIG
jgi:biotin carboxyl carrier protein